jgi:hypothetical protein
VLQIEPAQERLPAQIDVLTLQACRRRPQPDRQWIVTVRQTVDLQTDRRAFYDREFAGAVDPRRACGQLRVNAVSGHHARGAVAVGDLHGLRVRITPGIRLGEVELLAVLRRAPSLWRREIDLHW